MKTDPKDPTPNDPTDLKTGPMTFLKLFIGAVVYCAMQAGLNSYAAIVDFTKTPPSYETLQHVLHSLKPAIALGSLRGILVGLTVLVVLWIGGPLWAILGPFVAAISTSIANFVGAVSRAVKSRNEDKKTDGK